LLEKHVFTFNKKLFFEIFAFRIGYEKSGLTIIFLLLSKIWDIFESIQLSVAKNGEIRTEDPIK